MHFDLVIQQGRPEPGQGAHIASSFRIVAHHSGCIGVVWGELSRVFLPLVVCHPQCPAILGDFAAVDIVLHGEIQNEYSFYLLQWNASDQYVQGH